MLILIDFFGTLADYELGIIQELKKRGQSEKIIPQNRRNTFYINEQYPLEMRDLIDEIGNTPGFFRALDPVPGAIEGFKALSAQGHQLFICSSPFFNHENCVPETYQWVDKNLGTEWVEKIIITRDKTLVRGDLLIDDRPEVKGVVIPSWERILFDQPYNQEVKNLKRMTWANWQDIINN